MVKQTFQDIVPPEKEKTIRKIPLSREKTDNTEEERSGRIRLARTLAGGWKGGGPDKQLNFSRKNKFLGLGVLVVFLILLFGIFGRSGAEVQITPRQISHNFDLSLIANREGENLSFEILQIKREAEKSVEAQGEEMVERKASGEIVIYNQHSTNPQTLIRNTRFETPAGLIYRIEESVTVPGMTERGGEKNPGQIRVKVYADEPGEKHNIGLTDFTIPGFRGLPQYENFFARSATPITGGFVGRMKKVDDQTLETVRGEIRSTLEKTLKETVIEDSNDEFIILTESLEIRFSSLPEQESGNNMVKIRESGEISGIKINKKELEKVLVESALGNRDETEIKIPNLEKLVYKITDPKEFHSLSGLSSVVFEIKGTASLAWQINPLTIQGELAGKKQRDLKDILSKFQAVEQATATVKPFWKRSFPSNPKKIDILIKEQI